VVGDRTLLIITENIDKLLFGLGEREQWKFRAFLQETNCCSILATTPKISQDTGRKEKPFFGFFTPIHLPVFTHVDAVAMLINIANLSGNGGLVRFLETVEGQSRVRALHHLAGGNPRVYALFAQLVTEESLEALLPAVLEMLDKLTPYYQARVESLGQSDDQQKIVMYLTRETRAVTVKEITAQCFISSDRTTSNALKKLKEKGYVVSTQQGREVFYEISEVLMRLCLEMKNARSGDFKLCVDFLRIWYRPKELQEHLDKLELAGKLDYAEYFRKSLMDSRLDPILLACQLDLNRFIDNGDTNSALSVWRELVAFNNISEVDDQQIVEMINGSKLTEAIEAIQILIEKETVEELYLTALLLFDSEKWQEAIKKLDDVIRLQPNRFEAWLKRGEALASLGMYEEAIFSYEYVIKINSDDYLAWRFRGGILQILCRYEESVTSYDHAIEINPDNHATWTLRGISLSNLDRYEEAIASFNHAIVINPDDIFAWTTRGIALDRLDRYEEAINNYDHSIRIDPSDCFAWSFRGQALFNLGRYEEVIDNYNCAINANPNNEIFQDEHRIVLHKVIVNWHNSGLKSFSQEEYTNALLVWQKVFENIQKQKLGDASSLILEFFHKELINKFQQPLVRNILPQIIDIYTRNQVLSNLSVALIYNLKAIQDPKISDYTAIEWLKMWQELGKPHPELALALKMLEAGIKYKQNPKDDRIFLSLPQEMRPILREALGLSSTDENVEP
jgi:tetratricopeptide (TPR) repeat protein